MTTETVTPVEPVIPLKRYEMDPDRVEVRLSVETLDVRIEVSIEGLRDDADTLRRAAQHGLDAVLSQVSP